ncbi:unnamed protein product [Sphagnum compactum]
MIEHCLFSQGDSPEVALTEYEKLRNQNIQTNNEKLESLNLSSMPLKTPTFKNPKQKTPKGTEATMKMALRKLKAMAPISVMMQLLVRGCS